MRRTESRPRHAWESALFLPVLCREPTKKNPRGTLRRGKRSFRGYDEKGTGLGLFSGRWTIFQVSDYVSLPQLERLITARAELVSFIGASARWMERYRHFDRQTFDILVDIGGGGGGPLVRIIPNRLCLLSFADSPDFLPIHSPSRVRFQPLRRLGVVGRSEPWANKP